MYTITTKNEGGIFISTLIHQFPFDEKPTIKGIEQHADFEIILEKTKNWPLLMRKESLKYP